MRLEKWNVNELGDVKCRRSNNLLILEEFVNSDMDCAKVHGYANKNARGCAYSLNASIKRYNMAGIRAIERKGEVFMIREK